MTVATSGITELTVCDLRRDGAALFPLHYDEVSLEKGAATLDVDWERLLLLEGAGLVLVLGAFADGKLVGYSLGFFARHFHYDLIVYSNDALFVAPEHRRSRVGLDLIDRTEKEAKDRGAKRVVWHCKEGTPLEALLRKRRYRLQDLLFSRSL